MVIFASNRINESERYTEIETTAYPGLLRVRFYEETVGHVKQSHAQTFPPQFPPELPSIVGAVGKAINNPTRVEQSYGNSVVFIDDRTTNRTGHVFHVPVKIIEGTQSGRVSTYFFADPKDVGDDDA